MATIALQHLYTFRKSLLSRSAYNRQKREILSALRDANAGGHALDLILGHQSGHHYAGMGLLRISCRVICVLDQRAFDFIPPARLYLFILILQADRYSRGCTRCGRTLWPHFSTSLQALFERRLRESWVSQAKKPKALASPLDTESIALLHTLRYCQVAFLVP